MPDVRDLKAMPDSQVDDKKEADGLDLEIQNSMNIVPTRQRCFEILITRFDSAAPTLRDTSR